jgi:hypothetical protein
LGWRRGGTYFEVEGAEDVICLSFVRWGWAGDERWWLGTYEEGTASGYGVRDEVGFDGLVWVGVS